MGGFVADLHEWIVEDDQWLTTRSESQARDNVQFSQTIRSSQNDGTFLLKMRKEVTFKLELNSIRPWAWQRPNNHLAARELAKFESQLLNMTEKYEMYLGALYAANLDAGKSD